MLRFKISLGIMLLVCATNVSAATYYVDQSAGSDTNAGTTTATAWKNCPGMASYSGSGALSPGDTVYFDSADTWLVTGTQGLYLTGGVTYLGDSWGAGARAIIRANADLEAGVIRFSDHPTFPTVFQGFDVDANNKTASGVDFGHRFCTQLIGATKRVDNLIVHNIFSRSSLGTFKYGIIVSNHCGATRYVENVEILNSVVHDTSRTGINLYPGDENADCRIKNMTVRGNEVYNTGQDPASGGAGIMVKGYVLDAFVENNYVHGTSGAGIIVQGNETRHFGVGPTNIHLRYNILTVNTGHGAIRIYDSSSGKDPKDVKIYGNLVYNSPNVGFFIDSDLGNTNSLRVYNNTLFNSTVIINNTAATFSPFEFKNNIVYYPAGTPITGSSRFTSSSNNLTTNPSFKNTASLPTGFTGAYGVDMAPNTDGLSLLSGSPAIDAGIALVSPYNGSVNSVTRPAGTTWDIGAYEFSLGTNPRPPVNLRIVP